MNKIQKKDYQVDHAKLKEYFPVDVVTKGMFHIFQRLLGIRFTKLPGAEVSFDYKPMQNKNGTI